VAFPYIVGCSIDSEKQQECPPLESSFALTGAAFGTWTVVMQITKEGSHEGTVDSLSVIRKSFGPDYMHEFCALQGVDISADKFREKTYCQSRMHSGTQKCKDNPANLCRPRH
jgi:hypothetical protein